MKCRYWPPFVALLGVAGSVAAQSPGYTPPPAPFGPGPTPWSLPGHQPVPMQSAGQAGQLPGQADRFQSPMMQASVTLKAGIDKLLTFLNQPERPNKLQVAAFLDRELAPYFDFDYMAQWVAGPGYARMDAADRKALAGRLESSFLTALGGQLAGYHGQQVRMLRPRMGARGTVGVNVGILRPDAYPSRLEFRMYRSGSGWKVYDVVANGRSVSAYYRTQFQRSAEPGAPVGR